MTQRDIWEARYQERRRAVTRPAAPNDFARKAAALLSPASDVLELGCGSGGDAAFFAGAGHRVLATDFSESAVNGARERHAGVDGLRFEVLDMAHRLQLPHASYELVYARLSLHYFDDATTRRIAADIARLLRPGGIFAFMCKSTDDPLYGRGVEIEPDVFESDHRRHFFSEAYAGELLAERFDVFSLTTHEGTLYDSPSAWIEVIARLS